MTAPAAARRKRAPRECRFCGDPLNRNTRSEAWDDLCEDCDGDAEYCTICDDAVDTSSMANAAHACTHLRWDRTCGVWAGCGASDTTADEHRESFRALLRRMERGVPGIIGHLRAGFVAHRHDIHTFGSIFGDEALSFDLPGWGGLVYYEHLLLTGEDGERTDESLHDAANEVQLGVAWLLSLDAGKTNDADTLTVSWIDAMTTQGTTPQTTEAHMDTIIR